MTRGAGLGRLLPPAGGEQRVTFMELLFDLVYVVAVTQLSQLLLAQLSIHRAGQTLLLLVAVWSAWIYNAWLTSWFDADRQVVRLALLIVMLASLVMSAALPEAFGERGLLFAGAYLAERFQLFLMIALGESILVTGVTFGQLPWSPARLTALMVAFVGSAALWWIYFNRSAEDGRAVLARSADPGRLGRVAYTYFHLPMVAGIIVTAVSDELTITDPLGDADAATIATVLGGPALFLVGHVLFKRALLGVLSVARLVAIAALGVLVPLGWVVSSLGLAAMATLVLAAVAGWDSRIQQARLPIPPTP